ncbi:MAG: toxin YoeB [Gammaproteobacteria bacterium]
MRRQPIFFVAPKTPGACLNQSPNSNQAGVTGENSRSEPDLLAACMGGLSILANADRKILKRVNLLIQGILRSPFDGIGKPESLKHGLAEYWSRRINDEHRLVYKVEGEAVSFAECRYHY